MRKRKLTFEEMIQQNKDELLKDEEVLKQIDEKLDNKHIYDTDKK